MVDLPKTKSFVSYPKSLRKDRASMFVNTCHVLGKLEVLTVVLSNRLHCFKKVWNTVCWLFKGVAPNG